MTDPWESLGIRETEMARGRPTEAARDRLDLPLTLRLVDDEHAVQQPVFDPALKQHTRAYRASDPEFADPAARAAWLAARRTAMDLVLAAIAGSPWRDHLVLRGSVLLSRWFGEAAREPGDLDFVVTPARWRIEEERTGAMLHDIARAAEDVAEHAADHGPDRAADRTAPSGAVSTTAPHTIRFHASDAVSEDIWTYDRVPGRRLVLPWTSGTTPGGIVQLDFVFNESLPVPPEEVTIGGACLLGATPELSLAWKLVWLVDDMHPQGKDLYDAVLLAEHCTVDYETLAAVFIAADPANVAHPLRPDITDELPPPAHEWQHFADEYPHLAGDPAELADRLRAALAPAFRTADGDPRTLRHRWSADWLATCRASLAAGGLPGLLTDLAERRTTAVVAAAVTRELLGPHQCDAATALDQVLAHPAWSALGEHHRVRPEYMRRLVEAVAGIDIGA
ncbi:nucleotidyl transferase AbiEii/AbiGii toxin family protein [Streptomyces sp. NPDC087270]|uniref:nucleotidyl transferase AbiEii/AbiGii toxin family protein n=1 Tax=Streptomyces sp. NPDC087270 TaxID=3365774 RepID=UPI0038186109